MYLYTQYLCQAFKRAMCINIALWVLVRCSKKLRLIQGYVIVITCLTFESERDSIKPRKDWGSGFAPIRVVR